MLPERGVMSKATVALGSFIFGACSMFFALSGHIPALAQQEPATTTGYAATPTIPTPHNVLQRGKILEGHFLLDGMNCEECILTNGRIQYWGGAVHCKNCAVDPGTTTLELMGAAANGIIVLNSFQNLATPNPHKAPTLALVKTITAKESTDLEIPAPYPMLP
jgi:hypothetical protein